MRELKNDLSKLVKTDDMGISKTQNVLAKLFRQTLWDRGITALTLHKLFKLWEDEHGRATVNKKKRSRIRSANIRSVAKDKITWRVFKCGLSLLCVRKFTLVLGLKNVRGEICKVKLMHNERLSILYERILEGYGINEYLFNQHLNNWWTRPDQQEIVKRHKGRKPKGNMKRGLTSESLTWTFFMKGLALIDVVDVTYQLHLEWWDGVRTMHEVHDVIDLNIEQ